MDVQAAERELAEKRKELTRLQLDATRAASANASTVPFWIRIGVLVFGISLGFIGVMIDHVTNPNVSYTSCP